MKHGGDLISYKDFYKGELIDFSSNINPLGYPKTLEKKIIKNFNKLKAYPDIKYRGLKTSVAKYLNCAESEVIVGNGAMEIIDSFVQLFKRVIICPPCFNEYSFRANVHKKNILLVTKKFLNNFVLDLKKISEALQEGDVLILTTPNNPTGEILSETELKTVYISVISKNAFLLLDETFFEFTNAQYDSIEIFKTVNYKNVAIIRAATKFFGLPGLRLGYACTNSQVAKTISDLQISWSVNSIAEIAGTYIFNEVKFIKKSKIYMKTERFFLIKELQKFNELQVFESQANFILIRLKTITCEKAFEFFLQHGILVRKANDFFKTSNQFSNGEFIRIAVKTHEKNQKLLDVFYKMFAPKA